MNTALHEVIWDPLEMSVNLFHPDYVPQDNYHLYFAYDAPALNITRLDSLQYYYQQQCQHVIAQTEQSLFDYDNDDEDSPVQMKSCDITFGLTVVEKKRQKYWDDAKQIMARFQTQNFYGRNKFTGEENFLDRAAYLAKIKQSRYTLIVPAYYEPSFSIFRLIESLHNDCLPLIHPDCMIDDVNASYGVDLSELIVSDQMFSEDQRLVLLDKYKKKFLVVDKTFK